MTKEEIEDELYRMLSDVVNGSYPKRNNTQRDRYRKAVEKAIEALEQEPSISEDGTLTVNVEDGNKVSRVLVCGDNHFGGLYYPEQEPCADAISREDALMALTGEYTDSPIEILPKAIKRINVLPPVIPAEKVGRWKRISMDKYSEHAKYWYRCDRCGEDNLGNTNYCPHCGAKMQEAEE